MPWLGESSIGAAGMEVGARGVPGRLGVLPRSVCRQEKLLQQIPLGKPSLCWTLYFSSPQHLL